MASVGRLGRSFGEQGIGRISQAGSIAFAIHAAGTTRHPAAVPHHVRTTPVLLFQHRLANLTVA